MTLPTLRGKSGRMPDLSKVFGNGKFKRVTAATRRVDATIAKQRTNSQEAQAKEAELRQLERQYDAALMADALDEDGHVDPRDIAQSIGQAQRDLEALQRKHRAIGLAVDKTTAALADLVAADREALLREADAALLKAADRVLEATLELQKQERELCVFEHIRQWITEPERNLSSGPSDVGRSQQIDTVLAAAMAAKAKASDRSPGEADNVISSASVS
jgi:hypothetical protein